MINVAVERNNNENNISLIKRFTRRVQGSGVLMRVRKNRFSSRKKSPYVVKKQALKRIERQASYEELVKMGKVPERGYNK